MQRELAATQEKRIYSVHSPLGEDVLLFHRMTGFEQLGQLYEYELDLFSADRDLKHEDVLGQPVSVAMQMADESKRFFHGVATRFVQTTSDGDFATYRATVRPVLWFLTRSANCRIFQNQTTSDIVEKVLRDAGITDFRLSLTGKYEKREYCVQYRESEFNFISRLMEEDGMYYFFEHEESKHTLVITDDMAGHKPMPGNEKFPFYHYDPTAIREQDHVFDWTIRHQIQTEIVKLDDFDYLRPSTDLGTESSLPHKFPGAKATVYDYPGRYAVAGDGSRIAKARVQESQAEYATTEGMGNARGIATGYNFNLEKFAREDQNSEYLVTGCHYQMTSNAYLSTSSGEGDDFSVRFTALPTKAVFRAPRLARKPIVQGPQTAIVVGKSGKEIWTDEHGRVKVQFHWDRDGKKDENSSCWIRVSQSWAGKGWGAMHLPRIGQEVIVDFLEGDPDRPIVTGRVYNGEAKPPYKLPDNQTQSGILSRSTPKGDGTTFNELRFEDKAGKEEIYFHAERNFVRHVENDDSLKVGFDTKDPGDQKIEIYGNRTISVDSGDETITITKGKRDVTIEKGDDLLNVKGNHTIDVGKKQSTKAVQEILMKVGSNSLKIDSMGVTIKGTMIKIQGSAMVDVKAAVSKVTGSGMLTLKGGMLMVN